MEAMLTPNACEAFHRATFRFARALELELLQFTAIAELDVAEVGIAALQVHRRLAAGDEADGKARSAA